MDTVTKRETRFGGLLERYLATNAIQPVRRATWYRLSPSIDRGPEHPDDGVMQQRLRVMGALERRREAYVSWPSGASVEGED